VARRRRREPEIAGIRAVTHDGRGVADIEGKTVFIAGALPGERVRFQRRKFRRNFDDAELLEVIDASPDRIEPRCEVFGTCGGCVMQHVTEERQREIKFQALRDSMQRIGKVEPLHWLDPMPGPVWHYRRRARLTVKDVHGKERVLVGFRERHAPYVTDMHRCDVLARPVSDMIDSLSELIGHTSIRARLPQVEVAVADNAVALVFRVLDPPSSQDEALLRAYGLQHDVRIYLQPGGLDSVTLLSPDDAAEPLFYDLPEHALRIRFDPVGFVQINRDINASLVSQAIRLLAPEPGDRVLDLYCGIGNFSLPLARCAGEVLGLEGDALLVAGAAANADLNGIGNAAFQQADLSEVDGSEPWLRQTWDRVLLDPARAGAAEVVALMDRIGPRRIVYVSCHPGTLARDAAVLVHDKGYSCEAAGIIDMFPHTAHVESLAVFIK